MHISTHRSASSLSRRREAGSAYVVALLVLVVLSVVGIALTLITQTEVQIGSNEASQNRSFYSADSWNSLVKPYEAQNIMSNVKIRLNNHQYTNAGGQTATASFADDVTVTPFTTMSVQNCNICDIAPSGAGYKAVTDIVNSTVSHNGFTTVSGVLQQVPITEKVISTFIVLQPSLPSVFHDQSNDVTNDILLMKF
jgi:Tfp pilus assembly protein PilX